MKQLQVWISGDSTWKYFYGVEDFRRSKFQGRIFFEVHHLSRWTLFLCIYKPNSSSFSNVYVRPQLLY